jgi:hypothetical protein
MKTQKLSDKQRKEIDVNLETVESSLDELRDKIIKEIVTCKKYPFITKFSSYNNFSNNKEGFIFLQNLWQTELGRKVLINKTVSLLKLGLVEETEVQNFFQHEFIEIDSRIKARLLEEFEALSLKSLNTPTQLLAAEFLLSKTLTLANSGNKNKEDTDFVISQLLQAMDPVRLKLLDQRKGSGGPNTFIFHFSKIKNWNNLKRAIIKKSELNPKKKNHIIVAAIYHLIFTKVISQQSLYKISQSSLADNIYTEFGIRKSTINNILTTFNPKFKELKVIDLNAKKSMKLHQDLLKAYPFLDSLS